MSTKNGNLAFSKKCICIHTYVAVATKIFKKILCHWSIIHLYELLAIINIDVLPSKIQALCEYCIVKTLLIL